MQKLIFYITLICVVLLSSERTLAQPENDLCSNASEIVVPDNGFGLGVFLGDTVAVDSATREIGERCHEDLHDLGNCDKTVWYKFYIATTRNLSVTLNQEDSAIPQIFAGFTIYRVPDCGFHQGNIADQLVPLAKFGTSGNQCLNKGVYYIQVSAKERAEGELWVELNIGQSAAETYDYHYSPHDFGLLVNQRKETNINFNCLSIEPYEEAVLPGKEYGKSGWFKVRFPSESVLSFIDVSGLTGSYGYRLFCGKPTEDSVKSNKPFQYPTKKGYPRTRIHEVRCSPVDTVVYVQLIYNKDQGDLWVYTAAYNEVKDDWNSPDKPLVITVSDGTNQRFEKYFDCSGKLSEHRCKSVIPDEFSVYLSWANEFDTFSYAGYIVINSTDLGKLETRYRDSRGYGYQLMSYLYKGDIRKGCDLVEVERSTTPNSNYIFCLDTGVYTLVLARRNHSIEGNYVQINIKKEKEDQNIDHYHHTDPWYIGSIRPSANKYPTESYRAHIHHRDTSIKIGSFERTGRFVFYEILMEEDGGFVIDDWRSSYVNNIFKGRFSDNTIAEIDGMVYNDKTVLNCWDYKAGYYTIIAYADTSKLYDYPPCDLPISKVAIHARTLCQASLKNYEPETAILINGGKDLTSDASKLKGNSYLHELKYCTDCRSTTEKFPAVRCSRHIPYMSDTVFYFYTFYIDQNMEVVTPYFNYLYKGDARLDPSITQDSNNLIEACRGGNIYCNLEGKSMYTLVIVPNNQNHYLMATPHRKSPNDFAKNAYDFGHLGNYFTYTSTSSPITCHTTSSETDPCKNANGACRWRGEFLHQYPDTLNRLRFFQRRNLWYTFTVSGASDIQIDVETDEFCKEEIAVFKYTGEYEFDYGDLLNSGLDSTSTGLQFIRANGYKTNGCNYSNVRFENAGCGDSRYFILLESSEERSKNYKIKVKKTPRTDYTNKGDFCSNAVGKTVNSVGTYTLDAVNNCHTFGNSPFEDSVNLYQRSSWFGLEILKDGKYDISFKYSGVVDISEYSIFAGNCGALTKVANLRDKYSYFTLSCMGKGTYYIQAISDHQNLGKLSFTVNVEKGKDACAPYDFDQPIAQFEISGGCINDSIQLRNLSPQGEDMRYRWFLNNNYVDTTLNLIYLRSNPDIAVGNNTFTLIVSNLQSGLSDTAEKVYRNDTTAYWMRISDPGVYRCFDTIHVEPETNYPYRMNFEWSPAAYFQNPFDPVQSVTRPEYKTLILTGKSDNCVFHDTLVLETEKSSGIFEDSMLCGASAKLRYNLENYSSVYVNGTYWNEPELVIQDTGTYEIRFVYNGCILYDTMHVTAGEKEEDEIVRDSVLLCTRDSVQIGYKSDLLEYQWNTGSTKKNIMVHQPGEYSVEGRLSACQLLKYTVEVTEDTIIFNFLEDQEFCEGDWYRFPDYSSEYKVVSLQPATDSFQVTQNSTAYMTLSTGNCTSMDSAFISVIPLVNQTIDSLVCLNEGKAFLTLDGQLAQTYDWLNLNHFERYFEANEYGVYSVARENMQGCNDTIRFNVVNHCPAKVYLPNAFSPFNGDGLNDAFGPVIFGAYDRYNMLIANRWGEVIYRTDNSTPWNGQYMGEDVQLGAYLVMVTVFTPHGNHILKGTVTVVR